MKQLRLYLMLGYPGAGKTTASKIISNMTGAVHIWADHERQLMFKNPSHSQIESNTLYDHLNKRTKELLADGHSVVFDTSFNRYKDRQHLRAIADKYGAKTIVIWINTSKNLSQKRATHENQAIRNHHPAVMGKEEFLKIISHFEPPRQDEEYYAIDGEGLDPESLSPVLR